MALSAFSVIDVSLVALGVYLVKCILAAPPPAPYPPGPKGLPLLGNLLQYPQEQEWKTFYRWANEFGDMVMVNLLGQRMLIINSAKVAVDTLDKKSLIYSDRPVMVMGTELAGWKESLPLSPYGDRVRELRRLLHGTLAGKANQAEHAPVSELETRRFLLRVMKNAGTDLQEEIRRLAGAIILKVVHGYELKEGSDPFVGLIEKVMDEFANVTAPGAYLVDILPFLRYIPDWFPGASFKRTAKKMRASRDESMNIPHAYVKDQMALGQWIPSYTSKHLEEGSDEQLIKWGAIAIYGGGADTTVSAEYSFYLAMTLHPEAQRKAQAELDDVLGGDRLPTLVDREHLPYVDALVKEVYRWNPVGPQGLPHRLKVDDVHEGYFIPAGTIVVANIWKFLHDPNTYAEPMAFRPERFVGDAPEQDPRAYCFGFGRRICPGLQLADSSVFIACAMALAAFSIEPPPHVKIDVEYTSGIISHPKKFPCVIKPRSARAEALVSSVEVDI